MEYFLCYLATPMFRGSMVLLAGFAYIGARILVAKGKQAFYLYWLVSWLVLAALAFLPGLNREYWAVGEGDYAVAAIGAFYETLMPAMAIIMVWQRSASETLAFALGVALAIAAVGTMPCLQGILYFTASKNALLF